MELHELKAPFPPDEIEWRAGATNSENTKALALAYITSRAVMDRLDDVCGQTGWKDEYRPGPGGGIVCGISILVDGDWITKWDGADNTAVEGVKGGLSDAFKRAGVKWGIGRYLYGLPSQWVAAEKRGKYVTIKTTPHLPAWALPEGFKPEKKKAPQAPATNGKAMNQAGPWQWMIEDGLVDNIPHAVNVAKLLELQDMPVNEQKARVAVYKEWRGLGTDTKVAAAHAIAGNLPNEEPA